MHIISLGGDIEIIGDVCDPNGLLGAWGSLAEGGFFTVHSLHLLNLEL